MAIRLAGRMKRINRLFLLTVAIPTALAVVYFGFIASDRYVSESRFVIRSQRAQPSTPLLGGILQGAAALSIAGSRDDAQAVHDYILSRDALAELDKSLDLRQAFRRRGIDFVNHFPGPEIWDESFEALYRYYSKRVSITTDSASSVSVLTVSAFTADEAQRMNETLLRMSEHLVNRLNDRARRDTIGYATAEVREAERKAKEAALALASFRNRKAVIDPEKQATLHLQGILKLQEELIATKSLLTQLTSVTPSNPQIPVLRTRLKSLQSEIAAETAKVAGAGGSLANVASSYERLALEREFADKQLAAALISFEAARNEAQRQQLYLERIAQPNHPDSAIEPRRIRSIFAAFVIGLVAWGISALLLASLRDHLD